jgi:acetylornithine deacetylase
MSDVVELLRRLVSISSVSRESNRGVIDFAKGILEPAGWAFKEHGYRDPSGVEKVNLIAWPGAPAPIDPSFHLVLVCHSDTVPYGEAWTDATRLVTDGGNLHGCGACDVKGFLACVLAVACQVDSGRLRRRLGVVLTADEEIGCVGARQLLERQALRARYAIVGEPTSLEPVRAGKGYCLAEITVGGREAHSAFPERGESAIFRAARLLAAIEKIAERLQEFRVEAFSPAWTTVNVGEIHGGLAKNVVAPSCRFLLEWRPVAGQSPDLVVEMVREAIAELTQSDPGFRCEVEVLRQQEGFATTDESGLLRSLTRASGNASASVAFGTEAPWLNRMGAEAVVFGPGSMQSAHSPREYVPQVELHRCVEILEEVVYDLCGD